MFPASGRSSGEEDGYPCQHACLENSMDRGAWWATVHGVTKSQTRLSDYRLHFFTFRERKHVGKADKPTKSDASFPHESLGWTLETVPAVTAGGGWHWRTVASRDQGFRCAASSAQEASQRSFPEPKRHSATVSVARAVQAAAFSAQAPAEPLASLQATGKSFSPSGCQGPHL